jgi:hypothetical protein
MSISPSDSKRQARSAGIEFLVAAPIVGIVTVLLWQFVDLVRVESALHHAAEVAAQEAILPKATIDSVTKAVKRGLRGTRLSKVADRPTITVNDRPLVRDSLDLLQSGDRVEVTLGVYAADVVPNLLRPLGLSLDGQKLGATASFIKP